MATVIEGQSSSVGQIVKKVTSDSTSVTGPGIRAISQERSNRSNS